MVYENPSNLKVVDGIKSCKKVNNLFSGTLLIIISEHYMIQHFKLHVIIL